MQKILLVDDHKIIRDGIKMYFCDYDQFEFVECTNGVEALEAMQSQSFDLVLTDLSMPEMDGIELTEHIRAKDKDQKVLVLTMLSELHNIKKVMHIGANGYVLKSGTDEEIINAVHRVLQGENYFATEVTNIIMQGFSGKQIKPKERLTLVTPLSKREKEVLKLIVDEKANTEIAEILFISRRTVDAHKRNLLQKTGAKNVAGLVMYAIEHDLFE